MQRACAAAPYLRLAPTRSALASLTPAEDGVECGGWLARRAFDTRGKRVPRAPRTLPSFATCSVCDLLCLMHAGYVVQKGSLIVLDVIQIAARSASAVFCSDTSELPLQRNKRMQARHGRPPHRPYGTGKTSSQQGHRMEAAARPVLEQEMHRSKAQSEPTRFPERPKHHSTTATQVSFFVRPLAAALTSSVPLCIA